MPTWQQHITLQVSIGKYKCCGMQYIYVHELQSSMIKRLIKTTWTSALNDAIGNPVNDEEKDEIKLMIKSRALD